MRLQVLCGCLLSALLWPGTGYTKDEPIPIIADSAEDESIKPTWETRPRARTYRLQIPAPRGQIVDRNGEPLALTRVGYNLSLHFPNPFETSEQKILNYAYSQIAMASKTLGRQIEVPEELILKHFNNRGLLPLDILYDLSEEEIEIARNQLTSSLRLRPIYRRFYPQGATAGHIVGYAGRGGRMPDGPLQNRDLLWPELEGREGLELTFEEQLHGRNGELRLTYDENGKLTSERISRQPVPGYNVVLTLDLRLQRIAERVLAENTDRSAMVVMDPRSGDILAMASHPSYDPNLFTPTIDEKTFSKLRDDPNIPLIPRAYRAAYPPGSVFKIITGLAALESHTVYPNDTIECPPTFTLAGIVFRNHSSSHRGFINLASALAQSCNTWFYRVGVNMGKGPLLDWARKTGLGRRTGIPLVGEVPGRVPDDQYMQRVHGRNILDGDVCNLSIGQGDLLVSPLQMAQMLATIGNGGTLYQTRLVQQVQTLNNEVVSAYEVRPRAILQIGEENIATIDEGLRRVVTGGTGGRAGVSGAKVAGKTGTAQWGPKRKERTAAWFAGFAPVDDPDYAFAVVVEGGVGSRIAGGGTAGPLISKFLKEAIREKE